LIDITFQALDFIESGETTERHDLQKNLEVALKVGETNYRVMELLDLGHRRILGVPSPTQVNARPVPGKVGVVYRPTVLMILLNSGVLS